MKIFDKMYSFFESLVEYTKNFSNLFLIFVGAFLLMSVVIIVMTSFAYECKLTKTVDKINKFFERNPKINDDNLVAFNNMMKARGVPKILRRQWQQFMLYREHPASYYMSFKHCVENPLRNSTYNQQMTVYKVITLVLVAVSFIMGSFMTVETVNTNRVLMDILLIPISILVLYWLISMVLNLVHSAVSGDLFQNYQYFEINIDKAMLSLPEFVDYEVLFSQDEIRRGIPVLFAYLQKRAIQEQHELEKARLKNVDHEKFDFNKAGLDGSLVLDRAMRETENYTVQRKKYMQETERVNNEISVLENNYREQTKEFQRQVQTSKETVENLKEQLEQAGSTIEINYIKKQMRDELNRQQLAEKDFDILTDKHNQTIKTLNQEIQRYDEETKKAKEAMEVAMLSEFNTYSVKVYDNLEKIVDERMQDRVDGYKDQIKGLEIELEEKNEELENVYTRYQEALTQMPGTASPIANDMMETEPTKKGKKKKKSSNDNFQMDDGMAQQDAYYGQEQYYDQNTEQYGEEYYDEQGEYNNQEYAEGYDYNEYGDYNQQYAEDGNYDQQYAPVDGEYAPVDGEYAPTEEYYGEETYVPAAEEYTPADYTQNEAEYVPQSQEVPAEENNTFNDKDFNVEFENAQKSSENFEDMNFSFDLFDNKEETKSTSNEQQASQNDDNFDLNAILGLYDEKDKPANNGVEELKEDINELTEETENFDEDAEGDDTIAELVVKRKAGRPRKIIDESEIKPKRKPGRPRKDDSLKVVKKTTGKRGRPRKDDSLKVVKTTTGKRGRPRNPVDSGLTINEHGVLAKPVRKAGRPKKSVYCD